MTTWVLIVSIFSSPMPIEIRGFSSQSTCEAALNRLNKAHLNNNGFQKGICIEVI